MTTIQLANLLNSAVTTTDLSGLWDMALPLAHGDIQMEKGMTNVYTNTRLRQVYDAKTEIPLTDTACALINQYFIENHRDLYLIGDMDKEFKANH